MSNQAESNELERLYDALIPVLSEASVGNFDTPVEVVPDLSRHSNEIIMGVAVLLEVIHEKIEELEAANARLSAAHKRSLELVDEVLQKSLES
jgi:hypothetical protein